MEFNLPYFNMDYQITNQYVFVSHQTETEIFMTHYFISAGIELQKGADLMKAEAGLQRLAKQTRDEPECHLFEIRQDLKDPTRFTLWECWTDRAALAAHYEMPHTKAYLAQDLTNVCYIEELGEIGTRETA